MKICAICDKAIQEDEEITVTYHSELDNLCSPECLVTFALEKQKLAEKYKKKRSNGPDRG